jgi:hypothetical protein
MKRFGIRKLVLASLFAVACLVAITAISRPTQPASGNGVLPLQAPSFIGVARAEGAAPTAVSAIVDEAGISAYFQAPVSITISSVASLYRTIEFSNTDYIIGSISVATYNEWADVHTYIHRDGWVLAYYQKADPASIIFDWHNYNGTSLNVTTLSQVLATVADAIGTPLPIPAYYDFRFPNANNLLLVAEKSEGGGNSFTIQVPSTFSYYERSWSTYNGNIRLDGTTLNNGCDWCIYYGTLTAAQLSADTIHTAQVNYMGGLALVYRIP